MPVELVRCHTSNLLVPAHSEIILEGEIHPNSLLMEGPFGEFPGYSASPRKAWPMYEVKAITHRRNPILTMCSVGFPTDDVHIVASVGRTHRFKELLRSHGIRFSNLFVPPQGTGLLVVVAIDPPYANMAARIGRLLMEGRIPHYVIVVDSDTNIYDMNEVIHAISTKCHPVRGIISYDRETGSPLVPFYTDEERRWGKGAKAVFDCTFPVEWNKNNMPRKMTFRKGYPESIQKKVLENWESYGFKKQPLEIKNGKVPAARRK
jgi:4-hydroxy-3-polyprenylbenzoate decarboxylase